MQQIAKMTGRFAIVFFLVVTISACEKDKEDGFPITNDLRVLKVNIGNKAEPSGVSGVSLMAELKLIFSHKLNAPALEGALTIAPSAAFTLSYDATGSFVTIRFDQALDYETTYTLSLPAGTYGASGEASTEAFTFSFTTRPFEPPAITLSGNTTSFSEGETVTVTAELSFSILLEVRFDLVFSGSATGDGGDYTVSSTSVVIPAGNTSATVEITALNDAEEEGAETIIISIDQPVNAVEATPQQLTLSLGDQPPALEIKGLMSLKIGGTSTNGRAIHLRALEDIADLSLYGIGIANNGGGSDGREINFPAGSVSAGDDILLVRDVDRAGLAAYFGSCFNEFELVIESASLNFNGDDPFELYKNNTVIEIYGDVAVSGAGLEWEYTGTWAYKLNGRWEYGQVDCSLNSTSIQDAACVYPFCSPVQLQGVMALLWDGSGTNGGKAVHVRANRDIPDLSRYALGVANNGGGTDGIEYTFPVMSVREGDQILVAREPATIASYFGGCLNAFNHVLDGNSDISQNGDDAIELFDGMAVIETFGDANVDGTGQVWEYTGSWAFKSGGVWTYGGLDCAAGSTSTQSSGCPYGFCR